MATTPFRFDFCVPSDHDGDGRVHEKESANQHAETCADAAAEEIVRAKKGSSPPIVFLKDVSSMLQKRYHQPIQFETLPLLDESSNDNTNSPASLLRASQNSKFLYDDEEKEADSCLQRTIEQQQSDLLPGVYEGGLKVWECTIDLCQYLAKQWIHHGGVAVDSASTCTIGSDLLQRGDGYVLELGCGHGLPGCLVLREGLLRRQQQQQQQQQPNSDDDTPFCVLFTDYNEFVLRGVTLSNIVLNTQEITTDMVSKHLLLAAGDWMDLSQQLQSDTLSQQHATKTSVEPSLPQNGRFDLILAAETTYTQQSAQDTATLLARHLVLDTGVGLVATKRYYFGVGGGSDAFRQATSSINVCLPQNGENLEETVECHLIVETLEVYDNGTGNIRELLSIKLVQKS